MNSLARFADAFRRQLAPEGPLEDTFVDEIIHAAWRLRHCAEDDDKTRNFAHRILRTSMAELRRLQTDRQIRRELEPEAPQTGLASYREVHAARKANWVCFVKTSSEPVTMPAPEATADVKGAHETQAMPKAA